MSVANVSFSCPGLQLNIRDGVRAQDTLLYTLREDTRVTVAVRSSRHVARLELVADTRDLNTSHCYAVMHVSVLIEGEHTVTIYSCLNTQSAASTPSLLTAASIPRVQHVPLTAVAALQRLTDEEQLSLCSAARHPPLMLVCTQSHLGETASICLLVCCRGECSLN